MFASCVQEAAISGPMDLGLLVGRCANSLAAAGAEPVAVSLGILLPETVEEPELRALMETARASCAKRKMQIAGGHTAVSAAVRMTVVTVTGYGKLERTLPGVTVGQDIVVSKWIGLEGTALLAEKYSESLLTRYPAWLVERAQGFWKEQSVLPEAQVALGRHVCDMHDASEGGILAALWELAERAGTGLTVDMRKIPIRQETVEVCEYLGVNPYELLSGGCLLMTTKDGEGLTEALEEAGIPAAVIGKVTAGKDRLILNGDEVRYLDRPREDEIYRGMTGEDKQSEHPLWGDCRVGKIENTKGEWRIL